VRLWRRDKETTQDPELRIVVGLGNPGSRYAQTRHNVGFMVVNVLARRHHMTFRGSKQRADVARGRMGDLPVLLAQPVTYMNESGVAVARLVAYYRVPLEHLLVVCDDLDLPFGRLRLRPSGSSGGNRGLESIIREIGSKDFPRLRVGVGRPDRSAVDHVLSPFSPEQMRLLPGLVDKAADAVTAALQEGVTPAMNEFNRDWASVLGDTSTSESR
jgi:PTH1 family peptidyl-tRNA hydrolase